MEDSDLTSPLKPDNQTETPEERGGTDAGNAGFLLFYYDGILSPFVLFFLFFA